MTPVSESQNYKNITVTTTVFTGFCAIVVIMVVSASSTPTIKVSYGSGTVVNTFTPLPGTFYPIPARFTTSLIVTISGTVDCTVFWSA